MCTAAEKKKCGHLWFLVLVLGVDAFHRKESGYPKRDFASRPDRAYKLEIQIRACLIQDLQIGIQMIAWVREGSYGKFYPHNMRAVI